MERVRGIGSLWRIVLGSLGTAILCFDSAKAATLPLGDVLNNPSAFLSGPVAEAAIMTMGMVFDHRAYEPATPLRTKAGIDLGIEVDIVQIPKDLENALSKAGFNIVMPPVFPSARIINFHKGLSDKVDVGGSYFSLSGYTMWSADMKVVVYEPEEGLTWAVRLGYTSTHIPVGSTTLLITTIDLNVDTVTWTPQILVSRKMEFADPYLGIGYQFATGTLGVTVTGPTIPGIDSVKALAGGMISFLGVSLKVPNFGLRLTLEGGYSPLGFNYLGTKVGFSF